jgi:serine/threonine protein kinase/Flp pilus assembly protein TadD
MPSDAPNLDTIFSAAVEIASAEERADYIARNCGGSRDLQARVEKLVEAHFRAGGFLESPAPGLAPATVDAPLTEAPGLTVGPYKLLEQIGEGAFGIVFMAEQDRPVRRKVALKVLKPGMDTRQVVARFEAERQALALMDHANIAKVLDAGEAASGRPYFVMELVRGVPITNYCDQSRVALRQRLELFISVCHAVQHAHQKGIIHRDLKPSNILVTLHDGVPVAKVIDFGIAKALGQRLTEKTLFTGFAQMIGTPLYMSPEQAELSGLDIDTRSDIYSLGVVLYELLTGTTPFDRERLSEAGYDEMRRIIREEEPPKPSTRVSTLGQSAATVSAQRQSDPKRLSQLFRGELDWIVMKALEKDRTRRYETAGALAADVQRYLNDDAVQACPPSAWYRFRKFARRNRTALVTTTLVALALMLGMVISIWEAVRAGHQAVRATEAEALAEARLDAESLAHQEADANLQKARQAVDDYFTVISGSPLLDAPGLEPLRKQLLETALRYNREFIQQHSEDPNLEADVAAAHIRVAEITYLVGGTSDQWFPHVREAVDIVERLIREARDTREVQRRLAKLYIGGEDPGSSGGSVPNEEIDNYQKKLERILAKFVRDNPDVPDFQHNHAGICFYLGALHFATDEGLSWFKRAIESWERLVRLNPDARSYRASLARAYGYGGLMLKQMGRQAEASILDDKALSLRQELSREEPSRASHSAWLAASYRTLAETQSARNQPKEAEKTLRQALELQQKLVADFPAVRTYQDDLARTLKALGALLHTLKRPQEAEANYRQALGIFERLVVNFPKNASYRDQHIQVVRELVQLQRSTGKTKEAASVLPEAMGVYQKLAESKAATVEEGLATVTLLQNLAGLTKEAGQTEEAEKLRKKAGELLGKLGDLATTADDKWRLANSIYAIGWSQEEPLREALFRQSARLFKELANEGVNRQEARYRAADSIYSMAYSLQGGEREQCFRQSATLFQQLADEGVNPQQARFRAADSYHNLASIFGGRKEHEEEIACFRRAIDLVETLSAGELLKSEFRLHEIYKNLAQALKLVGRPGEGEKVLRQAVVLWDKRAAELPNEISFKREAASRYADLGNFLRESGKPQDAEQCFRQALALRQKLVELNPGAPDDRLQLAWAHSGLGESLKERANRRRDAEKHFRDSTAIVEKLVSDSPTSIAYRRQLTDRHHELVDLLYSTGQQKEVEKVYRWEVDFYEKLMARFPNEPSYRQEAAYACSARLGPFLAGQPGRIKDAEQVYRQGLAGHEKLVTDFPTCDPEGDSAIGRLGRNYEALIDLLRNSNQPEEAIRVGRQGVDFYARQWARYSSEFPNNGAYVQNLGHNCRILAFSLGHLNNVEREREQLFREGIRIFEKLAADHPDVPWHRHFYADTHRQLGALLAGSKRLAEAEESYRKALDIFVNLPADFLAEGNSNAEASVGINELINLLKSSGRLQAAEKVSRQGIDLYEKCARARPNVLAFQQELAKRHLELSRLQRENGKPQEAETSQQQAMAHLRLLAELPDRTEVFNLYQGLAWYLINGVRSPKEGEQVCRQAISVVEQWIARFPEQAEHRQQLSDLEDALGWALQHGGRHAEAVKSFRHSLDLRQKLETAYKNKPEAKLQFQKTWNSLGIALGTNGQTLEAAEAYQEASVLAEKLVHDLPKDPQYHERIIISHNNLAGVFVASGRLKEGARFYSQEIERNPKDPGPRFRRGEFYNWLALWDLAAADFAEAFKLQAAATPRQCFAQAALSLYAGDMESYGQLCASLPKRFDSEGQYAGHENELARACTLAANPQADLAWARRVAEAAVQRDAAGPWNHSALGLVLYRAGECQRAIEALNQSLKVNAKWLDGGHNYPVLAMAYHRLGQKKEAREALASATQLIEKWGDTFLSAPLGTLPALWFDWMCCFLLCREAKTLIDGAPPPEDPRPHVARGRALAALGEKVQAEAALVKAAELAPMNAQVRLACALIDGVLGNWDKALAGYNKTLELAPENPLANNNLAWLLATCPDTKLRDPARAASLAKKGVQLAPKQGTFWNTLGAAQYRAGDWQAAIDAMKKSMELRQGGDSFDWFFMAMAHWQAGQGPGVGGQGSGIKEEEERHRAQAKKWYDQAVQWMEKNNPQDEELKRFRAEAGQLLGIEKSKELTTKDTKSTKKKPG